MRSSKLKQITTAICLALVPVSIYAAGLGKLNVNSGLGEPLRAEIELLSVSPEELSTLSAVIASEEAYALQGIERPASHSTIKVEIAKSASGAPILKLKSSQPINDPYLDMLLQVDWASGRLLREYTVLLDPPGYTGESDSSAVSTVQMPSTQPDSSTPVVSTSENVEGKPGKSVKRSKRPATATDDAQEYVTQRGDTLAKIAREMKPEGVSLEQMLIGLYEVNPDAFSGKNINRLKTGQILHAPSQETLDAISQQQAGKEVRVHAANWNEYRNKLAGMVAEAPVAEAEPKTTSSSGKIKTAEDQSAPEAAASKDVVKLSASDAEKLKDDGTLKSLEAKITALQEEVTAREKGLQEAQTRTADLEKQVAEMQKLLAMKNGAMAEMQKQATEAAQAKPAPVVEAKPVEQKLAEATAAPEQKPEQVKPVTVPKPVPAPEPIPQAGFMDGLNLPLMGGATGLLALLGGAWVYLRNKRKKNLADFERGIMTSGGLKANTVFGNTSGSSVDTGDTSFLTDFSQSANGGMIDTHDVDPIAEAEVYMAYGRDAQAEEILKDAIAKEPKRYELHLKLLEMYAASKNMSAFETVAGELYTTLGAQDPVWTKVAAIGIQLEPNNPLYQVNSAVGSMESDLNAADFANSPLASEQDLDFNLDSDNQSTDSVEEQPVAEMQEVAEEAGDNQTLPVFGDSSEVKVEDAGLNFDMSALGDLTEKAEEPATMGFSHTLPDLDMSTTISEATAELDAVTEIPPTISTFGQPDQGEGLRFELTAPDFNLEEPSKPEEDFEATHASLAAFDIPAFGEAQAVEPSSSFEDINLDVSTIDFSTEASTVEPADNVVDLSGINLEVAEASEPAIELTLGESEPTEVETKLDLVAAYLDMDDKVGAKELLDEVLKEGGPSQRKRAEEMLQSIA